MTITIIYSLKEKKVNLINKKFNFKLIKRQGSLTPGLYLDEGLPDIYGSLGSYENAWNSERTDGALSLSSSEAGKNNYHSTGVSQAMNDTIYFNASDYNSIYGKSDSIIPSSLTTSYLIKYT